MFMLNQEELGVLRIICDLNDRGNRAEFYTILSNARTDSDSGKLAPVITRLDDDGYITSSGLVSRYCQITDKGRAALKDG